MVFITGLVALAGSIASMAAMVGATNILDKWERRKVNKQLNLNINEALADIQVLLDKASTKGSRIINEMTNRINSLPTIISGSDQVRDAIRRSKAKSMNTISEVEKTLSDGKTQIEREANFIREEKYEPDHLKDAQAIKASINRANTNSSGLEAKLDGIERRVNER